MCGDGNESRSRSPRNRSRQPPLSPLKTNYNNLSGVRHKFNSSSSLDRSFGGLSRPYPLPPIATIRSTSHPLPGSTNRAAQTRASDFPALCIQMGVGGASVENTEMSTPNLLRRPSQYDSQKAASRATSSQPYICSCSRDERVTLSPSPIQVATAAHNIARPYTRLPVNDILNHAPAQGIQAHNGEAPTAGNSGSSSDVHHPMMTTSSSSPSRSKNSISSLSTDSTPYPPFNATEERCYLFNTLYHICMDATSSYINNLPPATRHRHDQLPRHRNHGSRYHPYVSRRSARTANGGSNANARRPTLMYNIRKIATHIWRRARSDEMTPHRAENDAAQAMGDIYTWSEVIVRGMESDGINVDREEDGGVGKDADDLNDFIGFKVAVAAKMLCRWLGDGQAWEACHGVMTELRDLMKMEAVGGRVSELDGESLDGNIT